MHFIFPFIHCSAKCHRKTFFQNISIKNLIRANTEAGKIYVLKSGQRQEVTIKNTPKGSQKEKKGKGTKMRLDKWRTKSKVQI